MHLLAFIIPISVYVSYQFQGVLSFFGFILAFVLIPSFELLVSKANYSATNSKLSPRIFDGILYLQVPTQFLLLFLFLELPWDEVTNLTRAGWITSFGVSCGVLGINAAHELGHRKKTFEKLFAKLLLSTSFYTHFFVEHNYGHHRHVATPADPATARKGELLYVFVIRSVVTSFLGALKINKVQSKRKNWLTTELMQGFYIQAFLVLVIYNFYGGQALQYFCYAALGGIFLLETVNYIEHYGLLREKSEVNERFETVKAKHSWNSDHPLGRFVLFELSRHSDHHHNSFKKYNELESVEHAPQMPTGYPGMMLLALVPPLWFKVMNKKLDSQRIA